MTMKQMALEIVSHEDKRLGTGMSDAQLIRKANEMVKLFSNNSGLRKAALKCWYEREMKR